jgi:replicative DNA helicase
MTQGRNGDGNGYGDRDRDGNRGGNRPRSPKPNSGSGIERMPPQAVDVEQAVLGAMMIDARAIGRAFEILDESCFYHGAHAMIYQGMIALYERSEAVDQLTLAEELKKREQLNDVGGVSYLAKLASEVATSANIDYHAKIVLDKALSRKLIETASEVIEQAFEGTDDVQNLIDRTEERIFSLSENQIGDGFQSLEIVMGEALEQIERAHNRVSTVSGVETGFPDLNESTSGLQPGDLIILAARPSVGKTAFALSMARHAALEGGTSVAIFSLEMSKAQLAQRLLSAETRVDLHKLRTGRLREDDWVRITHSVGRLAQAQIYIDDTPGISVLEARAKARRLKREHGLGLVVVDYLQLMSSHTRVQSREQEISNISRGLKGLAKELNVPVLALSQLSRAVESRTDKRPQLSDLRESGCLTGDALVARADTGERVPIRDWVGLEGASVWALNPASKKIEKMPVSHAFCTGKKQVYRLTTRLGRSIRATANHKFLALEGWKRLDELVLGEHVALPRQISTDQCQTMSNSELALLGHMLGDGCVLPRHAVQYTTCDNELANTVVELANDIFAEQLRPRIQRVVQKSGNSLFQVFLPSAENPTHKKANPISRWFQQMEIAGLRSYEKRVPACVFLQPERAIARFLRHIWATDGAIKISLGTKGKPLPRIYYASSSEVLSRDIQSLLLRLGINARLKTVSQKGKGRDQHHVVLSGQSDIATFIEKIGTVGKYRRAEIGQIKAYLQSRFSNPNRDLIPRAAWQLLAKPALQTSQMTTRQMQANMGMQYCGTALYKTSMSRARAAKVAHVVQCRELARLAESDIYWDEVVSVEMDAVEEVFDLTVPGHHNFIADDIIVHNSIEQDADVVMFIYRPDIYGLKSPDGASLEGIAEIIIGKQRNGPVGSVHLQWNAESATYEPLAPEWRLEPDEEEF